MYTKNFIKFFLFPKKSAIPDIKGIINAKRKKVNEVTYCIRAVFFKFKPKKSM